MNSQFFLCLALLLPTAAMADVYKWVDENGVVHYSEQPPPDQSSDEVEISEFEAPGNAGNSDQWAEDWLEQQRREREEMKSQARSERELSESGQVANCATAMRTLQILELQCPVFYDSEGALHARCPNQPVWVPEGEIRWIDDAERAAMIEHYRAQLAECKK